jgi:von Willebrand factor type A domain
MRLSRRAQVVDTTDAGAFGSAFRRTRLVQLALAGAAVLLLAAAAASARDLDPRERGLLPTGSTGVVVLDLSLSIADESYRDLRRAIRRLVETNAPVGLVVFSDIPYELLPPGTPAGELRSLLRLLVPAGSGAPVNPWTQTFRAGTQISAALELARQMLERDRVENGSILLVSDLQTAPDDVPALARALQGLRRAAITVRVVPLAASSDGRLLFEGVLGEDVFAAPVRSNSEGLRPLRSEARGAVPVWLLVLGGLWFAALAAHERFCGRLGLPRTLWPGARRA